MAGAKRRPPSGGYLRGDEKRDRIIQVALKMFGALGYEKASTRRIAEEAGVNPPALQYYFESKDGLVRACVAHMGNLFKAAMHDACQAASEVKIGDPDAARLAFLNLLDAMADFLFGSSQMDQWQQFNARMQIEQTIPGYAEAKRQVAAELRRHCIRLTAIATGGQESDDSVRVRGLMLLGMVSSFHISRDQALESLGWPDFHGERLVLLKKTLRAQADTLLRMTGFV